jgi:hypothetical protein
VPNGQKFDRVAMPARAVPGAISQESRLRFLVHVCHPYLYMNYIDIYVHMYIYDYIYIIIYVHMYTHTHTHT